MFSKWFKRRKPDDNRMTEAEFIAAFSRHMQDINVTHLLTLRENNYEIRRRMINGNEYRYFIVNKLTDRKLYFNNLSEMERWIIKTVNDHIELNSEEVVY